MTALTGLLLALAVTSDVEVTPIADLIRRPELVNQMVVVDGRTPRQFTFAKGVGWNEFQFERSPVRFRLTAQLSFSSPPKLDGARVKGFLNREGSALFVNVLELQVLPTDEMRLKQAASSLGPRDFKGREALAKWAEARSQEYGDKDLLQAARQVEGHALRIEAEQPANRAPARQVELAEAARARQVPPPEPDALAHAGLRALMKDVKSTANLQALAKRAAALFPDALKAVPEPEGFATWEPQYQANPSTAYRQAPGPVRAVLDRRLVADLTQQALERQAAEHPEEGLDLAARAEKELPDRPEVARRLLRSGLDASDVASLRLAEVQERAKLFEQQGAPEQARSLLKRWLDDQRAHRLGSSDAEGRLMLARQYEELTGDQETAIALLKEAWRIDPQSRALVDAFSRRGYRQVNGEWIPPAEPATAPTSPVATETSRRAEGEIVVGMTRDEVRVAMGGKPNHTARVATQGQVIEQWIYLNESGRPTKYVNFLIRAGETRPTVVTSGSLRP